MARRKRRAHGEGTVTRRKDGRWQGAFYADGKRRFVYADTQQEALEKLRKAMRDHEQGMLVDGSKVKLEAYLNQWLEEVKRPGLRISTYVKYKKLIHSYIVPALGNIQVQKLTPQHVQSLYTKLAKAKLSAKTIHNVHGLLHNALDNAVLWNLVPRNVIDRVTPPRLERHEAQALTLEQARRLLAGVRGHRLEAFLTLALTTGMRRGELLALRWSDIDFQTGIVWVHRTVDFIPHYGYVETEGKTKRSRRKLLLPGFVIDVLIQHRQEQLEQRAEMGDDWQDLDLVVCGLKGGYFNPRYVNKVFNKVLKEVGLPHARIHDLRHSVVSLLVEMGVDLRSIQEFVGHEDVTTTLGVYGHFNPVMLRVIADKLNGLFNQEDEEL